MSDRSGNTGQPRLGDTGAEILQGTGELCCATTDMLL